MANRNFIERGQSVQVNPMLIAPVVIVILLIAGYVFWYKPKSEADNALRDFNTPEAQAKRDPDQRKISPSFKADIEKFRSKEQHYGAATRRER